MTLGAFLVSSVFWFYECNKKKPQYTLEIIMSKTSLVLWYVYNLMERKANEQVVITHFDSAMRRHKNSFCSEY